VNKQFVNLITGLHNSIRDHRSGAIFHQPVKKSEAPDYTDIVRRPIDLKTIKARLREGQITNSLEYHRDISMMFANAMMYNRPSSDVYQMAEAVCLSSPALILPS
jgi:bromodomain-containing protein 8